MNDLFDSYVQFTPIPMDDADVSYINRFPMPLPDEKIFQKLYEDTMWLHQKVRVWNKEHYQPRLTAWHGDPGRIYVYSGAKMRPEPWTNLLLAIKHEVENITNSRFNSVLLNLYRDHRDRMGFHSDNEASLGYEPVIASLSYGATRTLIFKHKRRKDLATKHIRLGSGSMLLMKGKTQMNWAHGINSESTPCGPRINLTFRYIEE